MAARTSVRLTVEGKPDRRVGGNASTRSPGEGRRKGVDRRRKSGQFAKLPPPPANVTLTCTYGNCDGKRLAKGLCRKHYERQLKHGDPSLVGLRGGQRTAPPELDAAGITTRQRNYWASSGIIPVPQADNGRYLWSHDAIRMALLVQRLSAAGMSVQHAGVVAQAVVCHGATEVELFEGVTVTVAESLVAAPDPLSA